MTLYQTHYIVRERRLWIRELETSQWWNDNVAGIFSSPRCSAINKLQLYKTSARRNKYHGHRNYAHPTVHVISAGSLASHTTRFNLPFVLQMLSKKLRIWRLLFTGRFYVCKKDRIKLSLLKQFVSFRQMVDISSGLV